MNKQSDKTTLCALCRVVTWTGVSKLTPSSRSAWAPMGVVAGLGLRLELDTPEDELVAVDPLSPPNRLGAAPGSSAAGLIFKLA